MSSLDNNTLLYTLKCIPNKNGQVSRLSYHFLRPVSKWFYTAASLRHPVVWCQARSHVLLSPLQRETCSHLVTDTHSLHRIPFGTVRPTYVNIRERAPSMHAIKTRVVDTDNRRSKQYRIKLYTMNDITVL